MEDYIKWTLQRCADLIEALETQLAKTHRNLTLDDLMAESSVCSKVLCYCPSGDSGPFKNGETYSLKLYEHLLEYKNLSDDSNSGTLYLNYVDLNSFYVEQGEANE